MSTNRCIGGSRAMSFVFERGGVREDLRKLVDKESFCSG